jgi:hypothetical protein
VTPVEIINEIKRLPPGEQAQVVRLVGELNRPLTGEDLGKLAAQLVDESDPAKVHALKEQIVTGFYGDGRDA